MGTPITRLGDKTVGHCYSPTPSVGASGTTFVNGIPVVRVGDPYAVHCCGPDCHAGSLSAGAGTVFADGIAIGRQGDPLDCGDTVDAHSADVFAE